MRVATGNQNIPVNRIKNDVFSLGMVLLHAAIGEHTSRCYDPVTKSFQASTLEASIRKMVDIHY